MLPSEINELLRDSLMGLIDLGYNKADLSRLLLGENGYIAIRELTREDNPRNFGTRPLAKLAFAVNHNFRLVYVGEDDKELSNAIDESNINFFDELSDAIIFYFNTYQNKPPFYGSITKEGIDELMATFDRVGFENAEL
jgi:hypothetical protein